MPPSLTIQLDVAPTLNFGAEHAGVPLIAAIRLVNTGAMPITGAVLHLQLAPDLGPAAPIPLPDLRPGEQVNLGPPEIRLPVGHLRAVIEAEHASLVWRVDAPGDPDPVELAAGTYPLEVLPFNHWPGLRAPPALLACYVLPNHPAVASLLVRVRDRLRAETADNALSGYQTRSRARVRAMLGALYRCVQDLDLSYVGAPASFETSGQKIRLPDQMLEQSMGNCLDLTVLLAACCEQMGLAPLLIVLDGHALPGVWLIDDRFPECVVSDAARLRTLIELGDLLVFDSSSAVQANSFEAAERVAVNLLATDGSFVCAVDVRVARQEHYKPLPVRIVVDPIEPLADPSPARTLLAEAIARTPETTPAPAPPTPPEPVQQRFRAWKERLLDLSLRNRLLNHKLARTGVPLLAPALSDLEDHLTTQAPLELHARAAVDPRDARSPSLVEAGVDPVAERELLTADLARRVVHSPLVPDELYARCVALDRAARIEREEGGANTLFMALGFLRWFEGPDEPEPREAPLLLVPVRLEFDRLRRRVLIRRGDDDAVGNVTLVEMVRRDHAVDLSCLSQPATDGNGIDVSAVLRGVREGVKGMARWEVRDEAQLGLFTFAKFLMWRDLDENADVLLQNPVVNHLANAGKVPFADAVGDPDPRSLDTSFPPSALPTIVDADATQLCAVAAAIRGRSFVLQGPPGTGKSQTITNLIGAALGEGRTVLFVSEKMAALEVVHRRLTAAGLGDYCLELHSNKASKKQVVDSLWRAAERTGRADAGDWEARSTELAELRAGLNGHVEALHLVRPIGMSFYAASARLLELAGAPQIAGAPHNMDAVRFTACLDAARRLAQTGHVVEPWATNPWRDVGVTEWSGSAEAAARERIDAALQALGTALLALEASASAFGTSGIDGREAAAALAEALDAAGSGPLPRAWGATHWPTLALRGRAWAAAERADTAERADLETAWLPRLFTYPHLDTLRASFTTWASAFFLFAFLFLWGPRGRLRPLARNALPPNARIAADLDRAVKLRDNELEHDTERDALAALLGWDGAPRLDAVPDLERLLARGEALRAAVHRGAQSGATFSVPTAIDEPHRTRIAAAGVRLHNSLDGLAAALTAVDESLDAGIALDDAFADLGDRLNRWRTAIGGPPTAGASSQSARFRAACFYNRACADAIALGLDGAVQAHRTGTVRTHELPIAVEHSLLARFVTDLRDEDPALRTFDGGAHHERVRRFRSADQAHVRASRDRVLSRLDARRPGTTTGPAGGEPAILAREAKKQRAHMPVRKLFQEIPNLLPRLKPCLLMSPLSVAQYLPADGRRFDLVVFDEASQIGTHDAIGAIARGQQVVIVGDSRQLPPTSFFARGDSSTDVDDNDVVELESILDEAVASRLPQQMLGWHYRSRHEALIDFSNRNYYEGRLHVFPAARGRSPDLGLQLTQVPNGVYEKGKTRTNPIEARALVDWLVGELRANPAGQRSFGVVTFSMPQQGLIEDLLDQARVRFPEIEPHFAESYGEHVFVKNLENVQGDERDVMAFSICYGPDENGRVVMNFGPLNRSGGERRLNVAITRARSLLRVFSTLTADQVELSRTNAVGARHLKAFLQFAGDRARIEREDPGATAPAFDSRFERELHAAVVGLGYRVSTQVGCGGYRIDVAVHHPARPEAYLLGVECDGGAYGSAATARDRDRLRYAVLTGLGWTMHRVWSGDWWFDKDGEITRLEAALTAALTASPAPDPEPVGDLPDPPADPASEAAPVVQAEVARPYVYAALPPISSDPEAMYLRSADERIEAAVAEVARIEAPMHIDELIRRVSDAWGVTRLSDRVRRRIRPFVESSRSLVLRAEFAWLPGVDPEGWRDVRGPAADGTTRDVDGIPPEEIAAAALSVLRQALSCPEDVLLRETARCVGITRLGVKVNAAMALGLALLLERGAARRVADRVELSRIP